MTENPEIGQSVNAGGIITNYHERGEGDSVLLLHGSGPGVSAWANWRLNIDAIAQTHNVFAPDIVGFGFTQRPEGFDYTMKNWVSHILAFMDAKSISTTSVVGNSFGGALALALAIEAPERIEKIVLMGSAGVDFELTPGLDKVWGYEPSIEAMSELLHLFAYDDNLIGDDLAELRYNASIQPGFQESYSSMFPAPRQNGIKLIQSKDEDIEKLMHEVLIVHGYDDEILPVSNAYKFLTLLKNSQLHIFRNCGHWSQIEHGTAFNALVGSFLIT